MSERGGIPPACGITAADTPDHTLLPPLVDAVPPVRGRRGRPRRRPGKLHADKACDVHRIRRGPTRRHIKIRIARRGVGSSQRLGRRRWVMERSLSRLVRFRRLVRRYDRTAAHCAAFVTIACILIACRKLTK